MHTVPVGKHQTTDAHAHPHTSVHTGTQSVQKVRGQKPGLTEHKLMLTHVAVHTDVFARCLVCYCNTKHTVKLIISGRNTFTTLNEQCIFDNGMSPRSPATGKAALNNPTLSTASSVNISNHHRCVLSECYSVQTPFLRATTTTCLTLFIIIESKIPFSG